MKRDSKKRQRTVSSYEADGGRGEGGRRRRREEEKEEEGEKGEEEGEERVYWTLFHPPETSFNPLYDVLRDNTVTYILVIDIGPPTLIIPLSPYGPSYMQSLSASLPISPVKHHTVDSNQNSDSCNRSRQWWPCIDNMVPVSLYGASYIQFLATPYQTKIPFTRYPVSHHETKPPPQRIHSNAAYRFYSLTSTPNYRCQRGEWRKRTPMEALQIHPRQPESPTAAASSLPLTPDSTEWRETEALTGGGLMLVKAPRQLTTDSRVYRDALAILFNRETQQPPPSHSGQYWVKGSWGVHVRMVWCLLRPRDSYKWRYARDSRVTTRGFAGAWFSDAC